MNIVGEIFICLLQVILFQILATPMFIKSTYSFGLLRNLEWIQDHPEILEKYPMPKIKFHYYLALGLLFLSVMSVFNSALSDQRWVINIISAVAMMIQISWIYFKYFLKMKKMIPQQIKKAILRKRTVLQVVPPNIIFLFVILLVISVFIKFFQFNEAPFEYKQYFRFDIVAVLFLMSIAHVVNKQPICHIFDIDYQFRRLEGSLIGLVINFFLASSIIYSLGDLEFINKEIIINYKSFAGVIPLMMFAFFLLYAKPVLDRFNEKIESYIS